MTFPDQRRPDSPDDEPMPPGHGSVDRDSDLGEEALPQRKPLNLSGWVALVLGAVAFAGSLLVAWTGAVLLAAIALALSITGMVRVYRGRATNKRAAVTAFALALGTVILGFIWADRAQPCIPLANDPERFTACYKERTGLF
ncbi:hypothetical protein [Thermasporomyces composti]|jgi:hypothetical protein|uniref:Uncharacterized protein n=1 Tax=Thermasporomyces composti TaxID=696763 RepID=A0A3D9V2J7_THECX|nr:hypothetical protein [Thermasporomyces composti]REF35729.1 hypothetical protein DFJ64_1119 [Thermasporomyces composti]